MKPQNNRFKRNPILRKKSPARSKTSGTPDRNSLIIEDLHAGIKGKKIIKGLNLTISPGEIHALMGPNGSGKSTLSNCLAGHPNYQVDQGRASFLGQDVLSLPAEERARLGIFLAFQYPVEVAGVGLFNLLKTAYGSVHPTMDFKEFSERVKKKSEELKIDPSFLARPINEGFSGGEKKKTEILQLSILEPKIALLDETDSGLDIDSLKVVAEGVNRYFNQAAPKPGILLITHYLRILRYIRPQFVHIMIGGKIVRSGGQELAESLEERGYGWLEEAPPVLPT